MTDTRTAVTSTTAAHSAPVVPLKVLGAYGLFGMPLAMAALPLYVHLPKFYAGYLGLDLTLLGGLLLALRLADGLIDPVLGVISDRSGHRKRWIAVATPALAAGMIALFMPIPRDHTSLVIWLALSLVLVYVGFSLATINHQAWGAELSSDPVQRTRVTAVREGLALVGVVIASVLPSYLGGADGGLSRFALLFAAFTAACAAITLGGTPPVTALRANAVDATSLRVLLVRPLAVPAFRKLLAVYILNGIAASIPATLVLFFIADVLQAEAHQGTFLALYFIAGAAGMPLWVRLSARVGKPRAWLVAMIVAVVAFIWAAQLKSGDTAAYATICVMSGLALGADLALPPSLLADVIGRSGSMTSAGSYFGLWTLATKLNLALAAGIALPLLAALGYVPGSHNAAALFALGAVYAFVPCLLKVAAMAALVWFDRSERKAAHDA